MQSIKKVRRSALIALSASTSLIAVVGIANASFMPGGLGGVLGGDSGGGIYSPGGLGDIFSGGGLGDIFGGGGLGDVLGGDLGGIFGGGNNCNPVIMNIAPDYDCKPDHVGGGLGDVGGIVGDILNGNTNSVFDVIFGEVSKQTGIPEDIAGILTGRKSVESIFDDILEDALESIGINAKGKPKNGDLIGAAGIPDYEEMLAKLSHDGETDGKIAESSPTLLTPNVIGSLIRPTQAMNAITSATTGKVLSMKGQELAIARGTAGETANKASANMGQMADATTKLQVAVAETLVQEIDKQESTQDTLKTALSGMSLLNAQATQFDSIAANQRALASQMDMLDMGIQQHISENVAVAGRAMQLSNELATMDSQKEMAANASLRQEFSPGIKMFGAMR